MWHSSLSHSIWLHINAALFLSHYCTFYNLLESTTYLSLPMSVSWYSYQTCIPIAINQLYKNLTILLDYNSLITCKRPCTHTYKDLSVAMCALEYSYGRTFVRSSTIILDFDFIMRANKSSRACISSQSPGGLTVDYQIVVRAECNQCPQLTQQTRCMYMIGTGHVDPTRLYIRVNNIHCW